MYISLLPNYK
ncbi:hypothetical protein RDI58_018713 [Solanum bulbocastanum]|uniref:Uncharacterized protein n=1 Tax=Solanum bulbocastanum TaxID=147425 RepID=A0AAN8TIL7_SOLBU